MKQHLRLKAIILVGWVLVICSGLSLIGPFLNPGNLVYNFFRLYHPSLQLVFLISSVILIGFVAGGIQLLKLREFGRSLVVFLAIIDIPHLVVAKAIYNNRYMEPLYLRNSSFIPISIVINILLIYFLSHPRIKKQFK